MAIKHGIGLKFSGTGAVSLSDVDASQAQAQALQFHSIRPNGDHTGHDMGPYAPKESSGPMVPSAHMCPPAYLALFALWGHSAIYWLIVERGALRHTVRRPGSKFVIVSMG